MLISLRHLVDRARYPQGRADDLAKLRVRFASQPAPSEATPEAIALAGKLKRLRKEMTAALEDVSACRGCAKGHPAPSGHWDGGHCCGGGTFRVFTQDEVASLKLAGTSMRDLRPPKDDHAGCAFRGATGCSLAPEHRPTICVRFICLELRAELRDQPRWHHIGKLNRAMEKCHRELFPSAPGPKSHPLEAVRRTIAQPSATATPQAAATQRRAVAGKTGEAPSVKRGTHDRFARARTSDS